MNALVRILRSALCALFFLMFGIGGLLFSLVLLLPVPARLARTMMRLQFRLFVWGAKVTGLFAVDASPSDRERFKSFRGAVVVANHISLIDFVILVSLVRDSVCVTKGAVGRNPFMRVIARKVLVVNDGPDAVLRRSCELLADGANVVVFPEGTRTPEDSSSHVFRRGAAHLSLRTGAPIETVRISCNPPVLGKRQPWWDVGDRTIRYTFRHAGRIDAMAVRSGGYAALRDAAKDLTDRAKEMVFRS